MLVLSRKVGDQIVIDGNITLEVVKISGNRISLGVVAPKEVRIVRGELLAKSPQSDPVRNEANLPEFLQAS